LCFDGLSGDFCDSRLGDGSNSFPFSTVSGILSLWLFRHSVVAPAFPLVFIPHRTAAAVISDAAFCQHFLLRAMYPNSFFASSPFKNLYSTSPPFSPSLNLFQNLGRQPLITPLYALAPLPVVSPCKSPPRTPTTRIFIHKAP